MHLYGALVSTSDSNRRILGTIAKVTFRRKYRFVTELIELYE